MVCLIIWLVIFTIRILSERAHIQAVSGRILRKRADETQTALKTPLLDEQHTKDDDDDIEPIPPSIETNIAAQKTPEATSSRWKKIPKGSFDEGEFEKTLENSTRGNKAKADEEDKPAELDGSLLDDSIRGSFSVHLDAAKTLGSIENKKSTTGPQVDGSSTQQKTLPKRLSYFDEKHFSQSNSMSASILDETKDLNRPRPVQIINNWEKTQNGNSIFGGCLKNEVIRSIPAMYGAARFNLNALFPITRPGFDEIQVQDLGNWSMLVFRKSFDHIGYKIVGLNLDTDLTEMDAQLGFLEGHRISGDFSQAFQRRSPASSVDATVDSCSLNSASSVLSPSMPTTMDSLCIQNNVSYSRPASGYSDPSTSLSNSVSSWRAVSDEILRPGEGSFAVIKRQVDIGTEVATSYFVEARIKFRNFADPVGSARKRTNSSNSSDGFLETYTPLKACQDSVYNFLATPVSVGYADGPTLAHLDGTRQMSLGNCARNLELRHERGRGRCCSCVVQ